jgi:hypothetical protein
VIGGCLCLGAVPDQRITVSSVAMIRHDYGTDYRRAMSEFA